MLDISAILSVIEVVFGRYEQWVKFFNHNANEHVSNMEMGTYGSAFIASFWRREDAEALKELAEEAGLWASVYSDCGFGYSTGWFGWRVRVEQNNF